MINIEIDGNPVVTERGSTVMDAAHKAAFISHFATKNCPSPPVAACVW
jgi:hypothetical protein